jgi:DNA-binding transcriptional LysR family regulator
MPDLDTALLRTFTVLAQTRSFSRTASLVGRTQSAVSSQIAKLEQHLGVSLFMRTTRAVSLTRDGESLRAQALRVLQLCEAMQAVEHKGEMAGDVRFGAPEDFASLWLPDVLASFAASHPRVRLHVECDLTRHLLRRFETGELDIVIAKQKPSALHSSAEVLWQEALVWASAPNWVMPTDQSLPLVLSPDPCVYRGRALAALDQAGIVWRDVFVSPSQAGMIAAVGAGLGVAVMPASSKPETLIDVSGLPSLEPADLAMIESPVAGPAARALAQHLSQVLRRSRSPFPSPIA